MNENYQNVVVKPQGPGTTLMKVSGILMIVFGAISLLLQMFATAAMSLIEAGITGLASGTELEGEVADLASAFSSISSAFLVATLAALVTLITGILAVVFCRKFAKGMIVIVFAGIAILMTVGSNIFFLTTAAKINEIAANMGGIDEVSSAVSFGFSNIFSLVASVVLPVLAIVGALKNKKIA